MCMYSSPIQDPTASAVYKILRVVEFVFYWLCCHVIFFHYFNLLKDYVSSENEKDVVNNVDMCLATESSQSDLAHTDCKVD